MHKSIRPGDGFASLLHDIIRINSLYQPAGSSRLNWYALAFGASFAGRDLSLLDNRGLIVVGSQCISQVRSELI
jgi:hypothetical protein